MPGPKRRNQHYAYMPTADRLWAYSQLGVKPMDVLMSPKISGFVARLPGGGFDFALECLRASSSTIARQFLSRYDDITLPMKCREVLPIEAFCIAAGVRPDDLLGCIIATAQTLGVSAGNLVAAYHLPKIVQASVDMAATPEGVTDRMAQLKHAGFLPLPKGSQVSVQVNASANAQSTTLAPSPEDSIRRLQDQFSEGRRTLHAAENTAAAMLPETIDAEVVPPLRERDLDAMAPVLRRDDNVQRD